MTSNGRVIELFSHLAAFQCDEFALENRETHPLILAFFDITHQYL